jgi:hypothetical protein
MRSHMNSQRGVPPRSVPVRRLGRRAPTPPQSRQYFGPVSASAPATRPEDAARRLARQRRLRARNGAAVAALTLLALLAYLLSALTPGATEAAMGAARGSLVETATAQLIPTQTPSREGPPTATPAPSPQATSTIQSTVVATSTAGATATPQSTATPRPTATPLPTATPTPVPFAPDGQVTILRKAQTVTSPPTLLTCDGCANAPAAGTQHGQRISGSADNSDGTLWNNTSQFVSATSTVFIVGVFCNFAVNGCSVSAGVRIADMSGRGNDCVLLDSFIIAVGFSDQGRCQVVVTGAVTLGMANYNNSFVRCAGSCSGLGPSSALVVGHGSYTTYFVPANCANQGAASAGGAATSALDNALGAGLGWIVIGLQSSVTSIWCAYPGNCTARVSDGQQMSTSQYIVCATASGWKLTANAADSAVVQKARLVAPSGYAMDNSTLTACSSPTVQSVDIATARATIFCPASGTARYDWQQWMSDDLRQRVAGKTQSEADAIIAGLSYVTTGAASWQVTIPPGYARLPSDWKLITLVAQ